MTLTTRIVHSYWSKPILEGGIRRHEDRKLGGWADKKFHYMSWALSCLTFKSQYGYIELITDQLGESILIDKIGLPYNNVIVKLNVLDEFNLDLWAIAKLYSYLLQDKPFLHVDGDVFIWQRLAGIEEASLVIQNEEINMDFYRVIWKEIMNHFDYIPKYMLEDYKRFPEIRACNAGIFGGNDLEFIREFAHESLEFLRRNESSMKKLSALGWSVLIYEQYLFSCLARHKNKDVAPLFSRQDEYSNLSNFTGVPHSKKYVHAVGSMKQVESVCENLADQLLLKFPEYYYHIDNLLQNHLI